MSKICKKCKEIKYLDQFSKNITNKDGLQDNCKACNKVYRERPEVEKRNKKYRASPESRQYQREYNQNPEYRERERKRDMIPTRKQTRKKLEQLDRKNNPSKFTARTAKYRAIKLQRTPKWLNSEQLKEIDQFYLLAEELQWLSMELLEVDHIVPLRGKNVSGLHVPWNLQILPKPLNASKSNKLVI